MFQILVVNQAKRQPNAANVRFCILFNKLFGVSVTQGKSMLAKRSAAGEERAARGEGRAPAARVIDLFFSIWAKNGENTEAICRLHCQWDVNPFSPLPDKIHDFSAAFEGGEIQAQVRVLEHREIDRVSGIIEVCNKYTEGKQTSPRPTLTPTHRTSESRRYRRWGTIEGGKKAN